MKATVVFQTDFGSGGGGVLAGVVKSIDPEVGCYDFDHFIEPYNIRAAAYAISSIVDYWPAGTVFVSVVDPGVGTSRRSCVARLQNGNYIVTPDNGILTPLLSEIEEVREIDETSNRLPGSENVHIFHGRDVYAYTAGRLAAGVISYEEVGPAYPKEETVCLPLTNVETIVREGFAQGGIYNFDLPYGCARVRISNADFQEIAGFHYGDYVMVTVQDGERIIFHEKAKYERAFGFAASREALLLGDIQPGRKQQMRFTINDVNFLEQYMPELKEEMARAADYVFTVEKL